MKELIDQAKNILRIEAEAVNALINRIDEAFAEAVDIMSLCTGKIVVTGMGKSGLVGKKIAATLASTGSPALFLNPAEGSHGDVGMVSKGDVVLAISNSGETEEIIRILPTLKRLDIRIIAMTGNSQSVLTKISDVSLDVSVKEEACPMGLAPTASTTAALAMGDALAITLLNKKGFTEDDFAFFHPGGNLGRKLLLTVEDLMHTGEAIPSVHSGTLMKKAIIEISSKRLGITSVVDDNNKLLGVITDGDLRREIEKRGSAFFSLKAGDVMTHRPKTIRKNMLAAKAVSLMEKHSITVLIVADEKDNIEGVIHLHDLLKSGIV
ncbi:MAG TPA: KpsF/GutQ family sugar-phosphate isomerase [Nitrospirae bacterium]|nr:arabinose 5-phosphate isomerase KdsD [bacterium BMS3Abin06]HDH11857.1 KpsF/GutQ family sugar-phosphate isomerase [Nitrospirota bacterium]HDZ02801.1 KpsF/GutQ family sugar-phosphate isomerase [Nitrospirota bacterium]